MKWITLSIAAAVVLCIPFGTQAQVVLNGGLETLQPGCHRELKPDSVAATLENVYSFGTALGIDVLSSNCEHGTPHGGSSFVIIGTDYPNFEPDAITLRVDPPLAAGTPYTISYYLRRRFGSTSPILHIGYSNDSMSFGTPIDTGHALTSQWVETRQSFVAQHDAGYISILATQNGELVYLDDVSIARAASIEGSPTDFPNIYLRDRRLLFSDLDARQVVVSNIMGDVVVASNDPDREPIRLDHVPTGCYIVRGPPGRRPKASGLGLHKSALQAEDREWPFMPSYAEHLSLLPAPCSLLPAPRSLHASTPACFAFHSSASWPTRSMNSF